MKCLKCGREISDNSVYCSYCGSPVEQKAETGERVVSEAGKTDKIDASQRLKRNKIFLFSGIAVAKYRKAFLYCENSFLYLILDNFFRIKSKSRLCVGSVTLCPSNKISSLLVYIRAVSGRSSPASLFLYSVSTS